MKKYPAFTLLLISTLFIFQSFSTLSAEDILLPDEESSSTFLEAEKNSDDVSLFLSGSWKANLSAAFGFGWNTDSGFDSSLSYPGIAGGFSFSQTPDITVSLLILNHYIFEAAFTDEFEDSTFMIGYRGYEGDFVQSISAGNMGINISEEIKASDYFQIPGGGPSSFGIHSALSGPFSHHELLLRFDPQEEQKKVYLGSDSVIEIELELHDYLKGRFFYVPAAPEDAAFYLESGESKADVTTDAGRRNFRKLSAEDYSYSASEGLLILESKAEGALLVSSASVDWSSLDTDIYPVTTSKGNMLLLYEKGIFSAFESAAAYNLNTTLPADRWKTRAYLAANTESTGSGIELSADIISNDGIVIIKPSAGGSRLYPLEGIITNPASVYGPDNLPATDITGKKLIFRIREESTAWAVDDPVAGTIRIFINGLENFGWSESGGIITFDTEPGAEDRIEIIYRKKAGGSTGGDILFASGNSFNTGNGWTADLNAGLRFNLAGSYSLQGEETSAYGEIAAGISYDNSEKDSESGSKNFLIKGDLTAGIKILTENASGRLLLKDMSGNSLDVALNRNTVFPGSLSASITPALEESDRGLLLYKDYRIASGISSYFLQNYNSTNLADDMILSPDESTAVNKLNAGPYTAAASNDGRTGEVLAMDFILPKKDSWTAVQIPVSSGSTNPDLSTSNAISFDCKAEGDHADIKLYLEIGSLSEDLDGDGILDAESSEYAGGYIFNDPNSEGGTLVGGDYLKGNNGQLDSEDINGNGFLDSEKAEAAAFFEVTVPPGTDWQKMRFSFTDTSGVKSRSRLKNAEFIRITAVNSSSSLQKSRILFDNFRFEGASMFASDEIPYSAPSFSEVPESMLPSSEKPEEILVSPTIKTGNDNSVMRISWEEDWKLHSYISPLSTEEYGTIVFYIMTPSITPAGADPASLGFNILDSSSRGIRSTIPLEAGTVWQKIEIKPVTGVVLINGTTSDSAMVSVDSGADILNLIEIETSGSDNGCLLIDEIYLADPGLHALTGISGNFEASFNEPLLTVSNTEIIGPLNVKARGSANINANTEAFNEGIFQSAADSGNININGSISTKLLSAPVSADISWIRDGAVTAGHRTELPFFNNSLLFSDDFKTIDVTGGSFAKTNSLQLKTGIVSGTVAGFSSSLDSGLLVRNWKSKINTNLNPFGLGLSALFLLSDKNHQFGWNNYFTGWYESTALSVDFSEAELQQRKTVLSISPTLNCTPLGLTSELALGSDINGELKTGNTADISISLPFTFRTDVDPVNASLGYSRSGSYTYNGGSTDFISDLGTMLETLGGRRHLYSSVPIYELFDSSMPESFFNDCSAADIDESSIENIFSASVSRNYSSRLIDLLIPYSVEFSMSRNIIKDFNDTEDELNLDLIWRSAALNLFGTAGVYPFFKFYFSDELNWSVEASVSEPFSDTAIQEYLINTGCSLFGHKDDIFSIDNSIYIPINVEDKSSTLKSGLMYVWNQYPEKPVNLPFFTTEDEEFQLITHEEKLSLNFEEVFSSEFRHTTSLILPQRFTLSAFGLAGFEFNNLSENETALFGFSFGISGSIIY